MRCLRCERRNHFRFSHRWALNQAKPVFEYLPGWKCDISGARKFEDLPEAAQNYVLAIEKMVGCPIKYVSVGAERDAYIER